MTQQSKHTPGPWHVRPFHFVYYEIAEFVERVKASGQWPKDKQIGETDANARLIAQAPEMYELLEMLLRLDEHGGLRCSCCAV